MGVTVLNNEYIKYKTLGPDYHWKWLESNQQWQTYVTFCLDLVFKKIIEVNIQSLLDVGCGDGVFLYIIRQVFPRLSLSGFDIIPEAIQVAKEKVSGVDFQVLDLINIPNNFSKYDMVICFETIDHVNALDGTKPKDFLKFEAEKLVEISEIARKVFIFSLPPKYLGALWTEESLQELLINPFSRIGIVNITSYRDSKVFCIEK